MQFVGFIESCSKLIFFLYTLDGYPRAEFLSEMGITDESRRKFNENQKTNETI